MFKILFFGNWNKLLFFSNCSTFPCPTFEELQNVWIAAHMEIKKVPFKIVDSCLDFCKVTL